MSFPIEMGSVLIEMRTEVGVEMWGKNAASSPVGAPPCLLGRVTATSGLNSARGRTSL